LRNESTPRRKDEFEISVMKFLRALEGCTSL
jgi:hypothetical protein